MSEKSPDAFRTISEVAGDLDLPQHVLRFWETKFSHIRPMKSSAGRRFYRPDDIALLRTIRDMLYGQGYTIRGVQRLLKERGARGILAEPPRESAVVATSKAAQPLKATVTEPHAVVGPVLQMFPESAGLRPEALREELRACVRILRDARGG